MSRLDELLSEYGESHQNHVNKLIHWFCVPAIMFSLIGLTMSAPWPGDKSWFLNYGGVIVFFAALYYWRLSVPMFLGFAIIGVGLLKGNYLLFQSLNLNSKSLALTALIIFVVAWVIQFIGHSIEGKKPSFLKDIQFLLIGPAWLLHFIYKKLGIKY